MASAWKKIEEKTRYDANREKEEDWLSTLTFKESLPTLWDPKKFELKFVSTVAQLISLLTSD